MWLWLSIALAGATGATCRYLLDYLIATRLRGIMPWGTWVVNITGSFALGLLVGLAVTSLSLPPTLHVTLAAGFLGAYTTFSTWMLETLRLLQQNAWPQAIGNLMLSIAAGLAAAVTGLAIGQSMGQWG